MNSSEQAGVGRPRSTTLEAAGVRVELTSGVVIVEDVSLKLAEGQILGLVGESGSGKTTTALALLGIAKQGTQLVGGEVTIGDENAKLTDARALGRLRGRLISYVPQDPANSLNPSLRIRDSIRDMMRAHPHERGSTHTVERTLARMQLPSDSDFARRYAHQLSGGQQQRVMIGIALVSQPAVVVLDEPTTGLDVVTQAGILDEIALLRRELRTTMVYVSHDLAVVSQIADRIAVMYAGRVVEDGSAADVLTTPRHPYTRGLVESIPDIERFGVPETIGGTVAAVGRRPAGCSFAPRCAQADARCTESEPALETIVPGHAVRCFHWAETPPLEAKASPSRHARSAGQSPLLQVRGLSAAHGHGASFVTAADDVTFDLAPGECMALVGQSGSGKTTIARCVAGLHAPTGGQITLDSKPLQARAKDRSLTARRRIQLVSQNPYESLNPSHRVGDQIARSARVLRRLSAREAQQEAGRLLESVRLSPELARRYPRALSGGERQRVAIARSLAAKPDLLICDEITSALDVTVQGAVLELLEDLRAQLSLAILLITHDLGVVAAIADRVLVLESGVVREEGPVETVLTAPEHTYTRRLIEAVPRVVGERTPEQSLS